MASLLILNLCCFIPIRRVMLAAKGDVMGSWTVDFQYQYVDLKEPPVLTEKGIQLLIKVKKRILMNLKGHGFLFEVLSQCVFPQPQSRVIYL